MACQPLHECSHVVPAPPLFPADGFGYRNIVTLDPSIVLTCDDNSRSGVTITTANSPMARFRFADVVANQRYKAREFTFAADTAGTYTITVTPTGFAPYLTLSRAVGERWQIAGNVLTAEVSLLQTGPMTLEVSSVSPYETGSFDVVISCPLNILAYWKLEEVSGDRVDATGRGNTLHEFGGFTVGSTATGVVDRGVLTTNDATQSKGLETSLSFAKNVKLKYNPLNGLSFTGWFQFIGTIAGRDGFVVFTLIDYNAYDSIETEQFAIDVRVGTASDDLLNPFVYVRGNTLADGNYDSPHGAYVNDNLKHFFCVWLDPSDGSIHFKVDNGSTTDAVDDLDLGSDFQSGYIYACNNNPSGGGGLGYAHPHMVDELVVWNKVLTTDEQTTLYNNYLLGIRPI